MNELLKNLGIIIVLIGACIIAIPFIMGASSNALLLGGFTTILIGVIATILLGKFVD